MRTFRGRIARVRCLAYSPDGALLVSAGNRGTIRVWDTDLGQIRSQFRSGYDRVLGLAFSPDGSRIVSSSGYIGVHLWSTGGSLIELLGDRDLAAYTLEYRSDGLALLASGWAMSHRAYRGLAVLWSSDTGKVVGRFRTRRSIATSTISPDGKLVAVGSTETGICFWDPVRYRDGSPIYLDAEHPNPSPDLVEQWVIPQRPEPRCVRFSPDGRLLATSSGWTIYLYDVKVGLRLSTLRGHRQMVKSLQFSPDGQILASASHDGTVRFWDVESGDERACFDWNIGAVDCAVFAPDGMTIAVGGVGGIVVWDVE